MKRDFTALLQRLPADARSRNPAGDMRDQWRATGRRCGAETQSTGRIFPVAS
jgi:hypothetical protein